MSSKCIIVWAVASAACCPGAWAERLWPDPLRQANAAGAIAPTGATTGFAALADDPQVRSYLSETTHRAGSAAGPTLGLPRAGGHGSAARAAADGGGADSSAASSELIDALTALGPTGVSIADYLSLALPGRFAGPGPGGAGTADAGRTRGRADAAPMRMNFLPSDSAAASAGPTAQRRQHWALSAGLPDRLTPYLLLAAALALIAGAGLGLAHLARRSGGPSAMRR